MRRLRGALFLSALFLVANPGGSRALGQELLRVDSRKLVCARTLFSTSPRGAARRDCPSAMAGWAASCGPRPRRLKFQINHANVYGINCETDSFRERHSDYASTCGYLDVNLVDYGDDVFAGEEFGQRLSLYDGVMTARGKGVTARVVGWRGGDVLAIEIDDQRDEPAPVSVDLRMLRYAIQYHNGQNWELTKNHEVLFRTASHLAASRLDIRDGRIVLEQRFSEDEFYGASAVAVEVVGRASQARYQNDAVVRLTAAPGRGKFTILVGAAASFDRDQDIGVLATAELAKTAGREFAALAQESAAWWKGFWSRGLVHLHSEDGQADFVEQQYTYFLYLMGSSSVGGDYPPRFGGMLWYTTGDMRAWGSQHWWANTECVLQQPDARRAARADGSCVRHVLGHAGVVRAGGAAAVGQRRIVDSRDGVVRRARRFAGRYRGGNARAVFGA